MSFPLQPKPAGLAGFRLRLLVAMMLVVSVVAALGLAFAQRNVAENVQRDFQREFQGQLASLHAVQSARHAMLADLCRSLARKPRIHAALEDNALDLLYPSAGDELADVMDGGAESGAQDASLHARFYRFLDLSGRVIPPQHANDVGELSPAEESQLTLPGAPARLQIGYLPGRPGDSGEAIDEVIVGPIVSTESGEVIAAIALGLKPVEVDGAEAGIKSGVWVAGRLRLPGIDSDCRAAWAAAIGRAVSAPGAADGSFTIALGGAPQRLFYKRLNPDSPFPPAYEVSVFPLAASLARQRHLAWQFAGAGVLLLLGAFGASHFLATRLSRPVEKLAVDSEENRSQRQRAEAALETTSQELQRSTRFSADASHQLKTPVTVLRAGLEELLAGEHLSNETREEISSLVHQTFRLANVIEDMLLLSRMDAGRLELNFSPVDVTHLVAGWLDDLGTLPDALDLEVETDLPPQLLVAGEKRYTTVILQNLLENARKYNRPGGRIRLAGRVEGDAVTLTIGNTGRGIPAAAREHIFDRFHRAAVGENVPGHGLGLNLARELARIHGGELRLVRAEADWTEFEVRFRGVPAAVPQSP